MRILIVDDNPIALAVLTAVLRGGGYEVRAAASGAEALELLRGGDYRLVITDWEMPGMDGLELCRAAREVESAGYTYIFLLSSHGTLEEKVQGLSAGADDFITKPFEGPELLARVRNAERVLSLETRDVAIFAMAKLAESRDSDTGAHLERVRGYCRALAQQLATVPALHDVVNAEFIRLMYQTSPLHDIGKVGIPDGVLLKAGGLTAEEYEIMKRHTVIGADTLGAALKQFPQAEFLRVARDIALTHHERWDGTGYPNGLAGEQIPLCGRIMAVADVYDALTSRRVYKPALDHETARRMIESEAGTQFDPMVVHAFTQVERAFIALRQSSAEVVSRAA